MARKRVLPVYGRECDVCGAKAGKRSDLWSFAVAGRPGRIFTRCRKHLKGKRRG